MKYEHSIRMMFGKAKPDYDSPASIHAKTLHVKKYTEELEEKKRNIEAQIKQNQKDIEMYAAAEEYCFYASVNGTNILIPDDPDKVYLFSRKDNTVVLYQGRIIGGGSEDFFFKISEDKSAFIIYKPANVEGEEFLSFVEAGKFFNIQTEKIVDMPYSQYLADLNAAYDSECHQNVPL